MEEKVMKDCKVLALCSQKGGVGKTTSCVNLAVGLAKAGKKVLVIDNDPQGSMTASLGYHNPDELPITLATILTKIVEDELFENTLGILHHQEGIDLIPANIELSGMEVSLVNIMSRELVLKQYIERMREEYNYILIDCMPSLGMLTINALASVDAVIIPVQAAYLPVKGLEQLIRTIGKVRRQLNKQLKIGGILITMVDNRTNYARDISDLIFDTYGSMTASLGYHNPDELPITLATILTKIVEDELFENTLGILHHQEGIDLIPANIELSGMEVSLVNIMSRELVLKQYIERMREEYNYILIDCMPSLGMLTINALASVDAVIIPVQAAYLPVKGLEQLIRTIGKVRRQLNKQLKIGGILITMVDNRTNYARDISDLIFDTYGNQIKIFPQSIPFSVRAAEISAEGISIFEHDPKGKVAAAYWQMTQEVLLDER